MFIEYSKDAIEKSEHGILKKSLNHSCTAMRDGTHVVCTENRDVAAHISSIMKDDQQILCFFDKLCEYFTQIAGIKNEVDVFVKIISGNAPPQKRTTSNGRKEISIGIHQTLDKYFWRETTFVTENPSDHDAYKIICEANNPHGISIDFDSQNGGGTTTSVVVKDLTRNNRLILCATDGDRHCPGRVGPTALQTVQDLKDIILCRIFVIKSLEIENLFLTEEIVRCLDNGHLFSDHGKIISSLQSAQNIHRDIWFFYDVKKGYRYKKIKNFPYLLESFSDSIHKCQNDMTKCNCEICDNIVIGNFGGDFLTKVLGCKQITSQIPLFYANFPQYMQNEWKRIARIILSWCCAYQINVLGV